MDDIIQYKILDGLFKNEKKRYKNNMPELRIKPRRIYDSQYSTFLCSDNLTKFTKYT